MQTSPLPLNMAGRVRVRGKRTKEAHDGGRVREERFVGGVERPQVLGQGLARHLMTTSSHVVTAAHATDKPQHATWQAGP